MSEQMNEERLRQLWQLSKYTNGWLSPRVADALVSDLRQARAEAERLRTLARGLRPGGLYRAGAEVLAKVEPARVEAYLARLGWVCRGRTSQVADWVWAEGTEEEEWALVPLSRDLRDYANRLHDVVLAVSDSGRSALEVLEALAAEEAP